MPDSKAQFDNPVAPGIRAVAGPALAGTADTLVVADIEAADKQVVGGKQALGLLRLGVWLEALLPASVGLRGLIQQQGEEPLEEAEVAFWEQEVWVSVLVGRTQLYSLFQFLRR